MFLIKALKPHLHNRDEDFYLLNNTVSSIVCIFTNKLSTMRKFCREKDNIKLAKQPSHKYEFKASFYRNLVQTSVVFFFITTIVCNVAIISYVNMY